MKCFYFLLYWKQFMKCKSGLYFLAWLLLVPTILNMLSRLDTCSTYAHIPCTSPVISFEQCRLSLFSMCGLSPQGEGCVISVHWHLLPSSQEKQDHLLLHQSHKNATLNSCPLTVWSKCTCSNQLWSVKLPSKIRDSIQYKIIQNTQLQIIPEHMVHPARRLQRSHKLKALLSNSTTTAEY